MKIESCKAGFSACGGSRSDKFLFAAVRSTRSAFCFIGNATQFPIKEQITQRTWDVRLFFRRAGALEIGGFYG